MRSIITAIVLLSSFNPAAAEERSILDCLTGVAATTTPTYRFCPPDLRPDVAEAKLGYRTNRVLISRARAEINGLRRNGKGNEARIAALEAAVAELEKQANCNVPGDPAATKACYESKSDLARALRGEAVALAAVNRGPVRLEVAQGASNGQPGYYFELEAPPPSTSPLQAAALNARLSLANDEDLRPIPSTGALGALGFGLGGALVGGAIGYGYGDDGTTQRLDDGDLADDDGDTAKTTAIGAGIGAASGLVLWLGTEGIIALVNANRAKARRRLVVDGHGAGVRF